MAPVGRLPKSFRQGSARPCAPRHQVLDLLTRAQATSGGLSALGVASKLQRDADNQTVYRCLESMQLEGSIYEASGGKLLPL